MIYKIKITQLAKLEIKNISNYIFMNSFSESIANKVYNEIYSKIYSLSIFPEIYPIYEKDYRVMTINKKYRVFYTVNNLDKIVTVKYVFSSSQNYKEYLY